MTVTVRLESGMLYKPKAGLCLLEQVHLNGQIQYILFIHEWIQVLVVLCYNCLKPTCIYLHTCSCRSKYFCTPLKLQLLACIPFFAFLTETSETFQPNIVLDENHPFG